MHIIVILVNKQYPCHIIQLHFYFTFDLLYFQVSWLRKQDTHLLTVGLFTYTQLSRFSAIHRSNSENWVLEVRDTQPTDQGIPNYFYSNQYERRINVEKKK